MERSRVSKCLLSATDVVSITDTQNTATLLQDGICMIAYDSPRIAIEASDVCFVQRRLMEWQVSLACHSWVSFSGFSEAFNEVHDVTTGYGDKKVAAAFFNGEMENELRDLGRLDMFGLMKEDSDREKVMSEIDKIRAKSVYDHPSADCSDACKERGLPPPI
ncbi:hypothetical protein ABFA07_020081 [Porites harrisoni]